MLAFGVGKRLCIYSSLAASSTQISLNRHEGFFFFFAPHEYVKRLMAETEQYIITVAMRTLSLVSGSFEKWWKGTGHWAFYHFFRGIALPLRCNSNFHNAVLNCHVSYKIDNIPFHTFYLYVFSGCSPRILKMLTSRIIAYHSWTILPRWVLAVIRCPFCTQTILRKDHGDVSRANYHITLLHELFPIDELSCICLTLPPRIYKV